MKNIKLFFYLFLCFFMQDSFAQALPAANKFGSALGSGMMQTLVRRGFAANDPRIFQTISAVSARTVSLSAASGSAATWASVLGRCVPFVSVGLAVYSGVNFYFDLQGKVYLAPPGSTAAVPIFSDGVQKGRLVYSLSNRAGFYAGSIEEAYSFSVFSNLQLYPDAKFGVPTIKQTSSSTWSVSYNYSIPSQFINNFSYTAEATAIIWNGSVSCPAGQGYDSSKQQCLSVGLDKSPFAGSKIQGVDLPTAYANLSDSVKTAPATSELLAEAGNRLWKDAALSPGYEGIPFSSDSPVQPGDFDSYRSTYPAAWPVNSDWGATVVPQSPISAGVNQNQIQQSSASAVKVDFGTDPGTPVPTLEDTPRDIFKPISDLMQPWLNFQVPAHSAACPTFSAQPSIGGRFFAIDITSHCLLIEQYRQTIFAAAFACWLIVAVFIVLSA